MHASFGFFAKSVIEITPISVDTERRAIRLRESPDALASDVSIIGTDAQLRALAETILAALSADSKAEAA
jgi:hypothetical protein